MAACISFEEVLETGNPQLATLSKVGASYPDGSTYDACVAFTRQVRLVEGFITQSYALAASFTKKSEDLTEISEIWKGMSTFCKTAMGVLSSLQDKYPHCGTPQLHDLALDYHLACEKRYNGVLEEIECQKMDNLPQGLFPALN